MANVFLNLFDKAEGEVREKGREKTIEILSWTWAVEADPGAAAGVVSAGKARSGKMGLTMVYSSASPVLLAYAAGGKSFPKAELQVTKAIASGSATFMIVTLENVFVSSVANACAGDGQVVQNVELVFKSIRIDYKPIDPKSGMPGSSKLFSWDLVSNTSGNS